MQSTKHYNSYLKKIIKLFDGLIKFKISNDIVELGYEKYVLE